MKRRLLIVCSALVVALVAALGAASTGQSNTRNDTTTLGVLGDVPYIPAQFAAFPSWVAEINADPDVESAVHLGDIKSGSTVCSDAYFDSIAGSSLSSPTRSCTRRVTTSGRTATGRTTARTTRSSDSPSSVTSSSPSRTGRSARNARALPGRLPGERAVEGREDRLLGRPRRRLEQQPRPVDGPDRANP